MLIFLFLMSFDFAYATLLPQLQKNSEFSLRCVVWFQVATMYFYYIYSENCTWLCAYKQKANYPYEFSEVKLTTVIWYITVFCLVHKEIISILHSSRLECKDWPVSMVVLNKPPQQIKMSAAILPLVLQKNAF